MKSVVKIQQKAKKISLLSNDIRNLSMKKLCDLTKAVELFQEFFYEIKSMRKKHINEILHGANKKKLISIYEAEDDMAIALLYIINEKIIDFFMSI